MKKIGQWLVRVGRGINYSGNWLGSLLLFIMFIIMMIVSANAITQAYIDIHNANNFIKLSVEQVQIYFGDLFTTGAKSKQLTPDAQAFLNTLEGRGKSGLDSNAISFLFQVFSLSLVSAGVYLLNRAHQNLKVADEKVALIGPFNANGPVSSAILGYLLAAYQTTWLLRTEKDRTIQSLYIVQTRDSIIVLLKPHLQKAAQNKRGIEPSHYDMFIDLLMNVKDNLEHFKEQDRVKQIISACKECEQLLKESGFLENYQRQLRKLLDRPDEDL